mgnify:CR=1 FL=1
MSTASINKKVIFLDWNGTLSNSFFWEHMRNSQNQAVKGLYERWDHALFTKSKDYIQNWMRGRNTTESVLKDIAKETATEYENILAEFVKGCQSMAFVSPKVPEIIKNLRHKGFYIVIATNNMDCFDRWTVPSMRLDKVFDEILNSYYLKGLKHDENDIGESLFFKEFFAHRDVLPRDCVFIDDSIDKNGYISSLGMKYLQIQNTNHFLDILESF